MVEQTKERYSAWERAPGESYEDFKKRFTAFYRKTLNVEFIKEDRELQKEMIYRAWEQMPGETRLEFKRRLKAQKVKVTIKNNDKPFLIKKDKEESSQIIYHP